MGKNRGPRPRTVCCAIPIARSRGAVLLVTSRKRQDVWILPKGGWEASDGTLEAAATREAYEEAGARGSISRYVTVLTSESASATYHFYELDVSALDDTWPECQLRRREWVDYAEAMRRLQWKPELAQALSMSTLAPRRSK